VLATVVGEIYGKPRGTLTGLQTATRRLESLFDATPGLSDVDSYLEADQSRVIFEVDKEKAMLHGFTTEEIAQALMIAGYGMTAANVHDPGERNPLNIFLHLPIAQRSDLSQLDKMQLPSSNGGMMPLSELIRIREDTNPKTIYHKNSHRVQYVTADVIGISPYIPIFSLQNSIARDPAFQDYTVNFQGEGEWKITIEVFRDLGLAFLGALAGIYILLLIQTHSLTIPMVIMAAIPLTMIGVLPGFWLLNLVFSHPVGGFENPIFFTATGMIGIIALAGIVVRNSIILIDFIQHSLREGKPLVEAIIMSGAIRFRPIVLTAGAAILGAWVIALDPIFSGLAWTFIFGIFSSTAFTLIVIPVIYLLLYRKQEPTGAEAPKGQEANV
jgi:multidrug efflux pump subunit AcrB